MDISVNALAKEPFFLLPLSSKLDTGNILLFLLPIFLKLYAFLPLNFDLGLMLILCNCSYLIAI